jgi:hypothetical protein
MIICRFEAIHDAVAGFWLLLTTCPPTVICRFEVIHDAITGFWLLLNVFRPWVMSCLAQDVGKTSS